MTYYTQDPKKLLSSIENGSFPRYLYKYRDDSDKTKSIFKNNQIHFSSPEKFNDPFDCNLSSVERYDNTDIENFYQKMIEGRPEQEELSKRPIDYLRISKFIDEALKIQRSKLGLLCLSKEFQNILMWSHYANNHKGIVIEFDIKQDPDFFISPIEVNYIDTYEPINYPKNERKSIEKIVSTKSNDWKYESEVRIIKANTNGLIKFKPSSISKIYFGCRSEKSFINEIKNLCLKDELKHIEFFLMEKEKFEFSLKPKKL